MKKITFRIVMAQGLRVGDDAPPVAGELVVFRSDRPLLAGEVSSYRAAPCSEYEYARAALRNVGDQPVSDAITLEATSELPAGDVIGGDAPRAVYSCLLVTRGGEQFLFDGFRVPESLSETTTYAALCVANQPPH